MWPFWGDLERLVSQKSGWKNHVILHKPSRARFCGMRPMTSLWIALLFAVAEVCVALGVLKRFGEKLERVAAVVIAIGMCVSGGFAIGEHAADGKESTDRGNRLDASEKREAALSNEIVKAKAQLAAQVELTKPRRVNDQQSARIIGYLANKPNSEWRLQIEIGSKETETLARDIHDTLMKAGWKCSESSATMSFSNREGIWIGGTNVQAILILANGLAGAGIKVTVATNTYQKDPVAVFVGPKS
jgi:hypothetical protein